MDISRVQSNSHSQSMQAQYQPQRKAPETKSVDLSRQESHNQDIIKRKKQGEHLNIGEEKLVEMIEKVNKSLLTPPTELQFSIHEKTKKISVKIINTESKEVIREIPSEKVLDMVAKMWELVGLFIDEKA